MRRGLLVIAALVAVPLALWGLTSRPATPEASPDSTHEPIASAVAFDAGPELPPGAILRIHVLVDGAPAEGAEAMLDFDREHAGYKAAEPGLIEIRGLEAKERYLYVTAPEAGEAAEQRVHLEPGAVLELSYDLIRGRRLEGLVLDEDGGPMNCALIRAVDNEQGHHDAGEVTYFSAITEHVLTGPDGRFAVFAEPSHRRLAFNVTHEGYRDLSKELSTLEEARGGLMLSMTPWPRYDGKVIDEHGRPVEHFTVNRIPYQGGRFSLPVPYDLEDKRPFRVAIAAKGFQPLVAQVDPSDPDHVFELAAGEPLIPLPEEKPFPAGSEAARCPWLLRRYR